MELSGQVPAPAALTLGKGRKCTFIEWDNAWVRVPTAALDSLDKIKNLETSAVWTLHPAARSLVSTLTRRLKGESRKCHFCLKFGWNLMRNSYHTKHGIPTCGPSDCISSFKKFPELAGNLDRNSLLWFTGVAVWRKFLYIDMFCRLRVVLRRKRPENWRKNVRFFFSFTTMLQHTGRFRWRIS